MSVNSTHTVERIARVLAGERHSANAEGAEASAGDTVDGRWPEYCAQAVAVLKSLREAPPEIAEAGVGEAWSRAIAAALGDEADAADTSQREAAESVGHFLNAPT